MKEEKNLTQQELADIRLETSRNIILTFRDIYDLKDIKEWADREWEDHLIVWNYMEQVRMTCLQKDRGDLWEEWRKNHKMSYVGFQTLNDLMEKLDK